MKYLKLEFLSFVDMVLIALCFIVFLAFAREFKITRLVALQGFIFSARFFMFQAWRRKRLLEQFEEREKILKLLDDEFLSLKAQAKITEEFYYRWNHEFEYAKVQAGLAIMKADADLIQSAVEIERDYKNMTVDESIVRIKEALQEGFA